MSNSDSIAEKVIDFVREFIRSFKDGYLFFGSRDDIVRYVIDILLIAFLCYCFLVFLRQTRAWQLIKGMILILIFVVICSFFGLEMVGFIFNKLVYVFAFAVIVLFQPELRRVLETVGIRSFGKIKSTFGNTGADSQSASLINEICSACKEMSKTYTGALILIEQTTSLEEFLSQENVVRMDSSVSSSVLQSIFYKGAPMHDGAVLIRNNRIIATRCHVPLSVTMKKLERAGTRHRAAVGASEIGDTIAVVVSEERGKTSIAFNGRLYEMKDSKELEANLAYLLGVTDESADKKTISSVLKNFFGKRNEPVLVIDDEVNDQDTEKPANVVIADSVNKKLIRAKSQAQKSGTDSTLIKNYAERQKNTKVSIAQRLVFVVISLIFSVGLWMYIQINNNPITERSITIPITYGSESTDYNMAFPISEVQVTVVGRQNTINSLDSSKITASLDESAITGTGFIDLPIVIDSNDDTVYFRVSRQLPETILVNVFDKHED